MEIVCDYDLFENVYQISKIFTTGPDTFDGTPNWIKEYKSFLNNQTQKIQNSNWFMNHKNMLDDIISKYPDDLPF